MNALPSSIESALSEAGFSMTEILVVQRLVQEPAITIRQLAAKTGKSTGVLDQAMKKLLRKRIVNREIINDSPKYTLNSLASVSQWILQDVQSKRDALLRRYQNFESFMATLEMDKARPEMKYFEGDEGMQQAYMKLLESGEEMKEYFPIVQKEEEDRFREFRVKYFRARQGRKIFTRVITHDTPLGRRYQSKDAFEYRQTVLIPSESFPIGFEKIIVGDTVACFNHAEKKVCFIKYEEFAKAESELFETLWKANVGRVLPTARPLQSVSLKTKLFSQLREAFLSPKSLAILAFCCVISGFLTYGLYRYTLRIIINGEGEKMIESAINSAAKISDIDLSRIRKANDMKSEEYQKVFAILNDIRHLNKSIKYAYVLRPTDQFNIWEFVADADSNYDLPSEIDMDNNQKITSDEENVAPGVAYDIKQSPETTIDGPYIENNFSTDQWGTFLTAGAPILNKQGQAVAVIALDQDVTDIYARVKKIFIPWFVFGIIFLGTIIFRIIQISHSLFQSFTKKAA